MSIVKMKKLPGRNSISTPDFVLIVHSCHGSTWYALSNMLFTGE